MRGAILILAVVTGGCSSDHDAPPHSPVVETIAVASASGAGNGLEITGTIHSRFETDLGFRVGGIIVERLVDRGQIVRRGQVLARLDAHDLQQGAASRSAAAAAAVSEAVAAEVAASLAAAEERRLRGLDTAGAVAPLTYDRTRDQARGAAQQAMAARARATAARADAALAENQSGYSVIRAPANGVITDVAGEPGQVVGAGARVISFAAAGPREAEVHLPEHMLAAARRSPHAALYGIGGYAPAMLRELSAAADPITRTYQARYVLSGADARAPLGSTVTIKLSDSGASRTLVQVPVSAIIKRGGRPFVYLVSRAGLRVVPRAVAIVALGSETATVRGPLAVGDTIVRLGGFLLKPGQQVQPAPHGQATGA